MFSLWIAYTVVWLAYGMRLIQSALLQVAPELEEAGRSAGGTRTRVSLDVTLPLRADEVTEVDLRVTYQSVAPAVEDGLYLVPKVIE